MSNAGGGQGARVSRRRLFQGVVAGAAVFGLGSAGAFALRDRLPFARGDERPSGVSGGPAGSGGTPAVEVASTGTDAWQLLVRGRPWYVKGVAYGLPQEDVARHLDDLAELGVNTLRTYSADLEKTKVLLDAAAARGMRVVVGFWLRQDADYREGSADADYLEQTLADVAAVGRAFSGHEGVLLWDVGNEVMGLMRNGSDDDRDERRAAYASYVERLAVALHEADPEHPVTSTDSATAMWRYYRDHSPSLDLLAVNAYKAVAQVERAWRRDGHDRPYLVTETGAAGDWEVPADEYDVPEEGDDDEKAAEFGLAWDAVVAGGGPSLGATVFGYNDANTYVGMWRYLFVDGERRPTWYALQRALKGSGQDRPLGLSVTPPDETALRPGETFTVGLDVEGATAEGASFEVRLFNYDAVLKGSYAVEGRLSLTDARSRVLDDGRLEVEAPLEEGAWKVYVIAKDGQGSACVAPLTVEVSRSSS